MRWTKASNYAVISSCGHYSVAKIGSASGTFTYEAWRTNSHPKGRERLGSYPTPAEAKERVERESA